MTLAEYLEPMIKAARQQMVTLERFRALAGSGVDPKTTANGIRNFIVEADSAVAGKRHSGVEFTNNGQPGDG